MHTVWKFKLPLEDRQIIEMPKGAEILTVQVQNAEPCLWARVPDTYADNEDRYIRIVGTGHSLPTTEEVLQYIGTYQLQAGTLVFHAFEIKIKEQ